MLYRVDDEKRIVYVPTSVVIQTGASATNGVDVALTGQAGRHTLQSEQTERGTRSMTAVVFHTYLTRSRPRKTDL
jgi:hypothetical protein